MRSRCVKLPCFILLLPVLLTPNLIKSQSTRTPGKSIRAITLAKATGVDNPFWTPNRIGSYITNKGIIVDFRPTGRAGMEWPVGSGHTVNFASGIWLAGIKEAEFVTAAAEYITEFQPGVVRRPAPGVVGVPADPQDDRFKVYIIDRQDITKPRNNPDYLNWPVTDGAPVDENGKPLLLGASTAWAVFNDFDQSLHDNLFYSQPMGVEVQMTAWAFNKTNALGDMMFFRFKIINKSGRDIDETYVGFWADADIGDIKDLVGCDTTLSLGFNYKTQADQVYGENPPAIGYDLLQGPIVPAPGETASVSGRKISDFKNLPMTAFNKHINTSFYRTSPENAPEVHSYMQGMDIFGDHPINETTGQPTNFWYSGDPVAGTGWLDIDHADKRFLVSSGPFNFADGDSQEVVLGVIVAQGRTPLESVALLKRRSQVAQFAYDNNFPVPPPPPAPTVTIQPVESSIFLTWDDTAERYFVADHIDIDPASRGAPTAYTFQGYNVYQLDSPAITPETEILKIAGFDLIDGVVKIRDDVFQPATGDIVNRTVQDARDTGLQRFLRMTKDAFSEDAPLNLFQPYYFAVTAYGYNAIGAPKTFESPLHPFTARPQGPPLGTSITAPPEDTLAAAHISGTSEGTSVRPFILEPALLTGHDYEVRFRLTGNGIVYDTWDITTDTRVDSNRSNQDNVLGELDYPLVDGVLVQVFGPLVAFQNFEAVANAAGLLDPPEGAAADFQGFPAVRPTPRQQVGEGKWFVHVADTGAGFSASYEAFLAQISKTGQMRWGEIVPYDYEIRFTARGSYAYDPYFTHAIFKAPFELWNIGIGTPDDPNDDFRMIPYVLDDDASNTFNMPPPGTRAFGDDEHAASGGSNDPYTDWIYWATPDDKTPGESGYLTWEAAALAIPGLKDNGAFYNVLAKDDNMQRMVLINWNGGQTPPFNQELPEEGTIFRLTTTKPNAPDDVFRYSTPAQIRNDLELARQQAQLANVFPNPYDRGSINLRNPTNQRVTFTHLPESDAIIRIYSLFGDLVRKIAHNNGTQFEFWDLRNEDGRTVASSLYIVHIDMGEIGVKVLKLAVF